MLQVRIQSWASVVRVTGLEVLNPDHMNIECPWKIESQAVGPATTALGFTFKTRRTFLCVPTL